MEKAKMRIFYADIDSLGSEHTEVYGYHSGSLRCDMEGELYGSLPPVCGAVVGFLIVHIRDRGS